MAVAWKSRARRPIHPDHAEIRLGLGRAVAVHIREIEAHCWPDARPAILRTIRSEFQSGRTSPARTSRARGQEIRDSPRLDRGHRRGCHQDRHGTRGLSLRAQTANVARRARAGGLATGLAARHPQAPLRDAASKLPPDAEAYRQTTVMMGVQGFGFRATGREPIEAGCRGAVRDWTRDEEKREASQVLPPRRDLRGGSRRFRPSCYHRGYVTAGLLTREAARSVAVMGLSRWTS